MAKVAVLAVPFILSDLHVSWAKETLASLRSEHELDLIAIVNRYRQGKGDLEWLQSVFQVVEENDKNILARAWNKGVSLAFSRGAEYVLLINLDLVFHPLCIDNLVACAQRNPDTVMWSATAWADLATLKDAVLEDVCDAHIHFSCFMVNKQFLEVLGEFDEQFEYAYLEDSDMRYRLRLAGLREVSARNALFYHLDRGTFKGIIDGDITEVRQHKRFMEELSEALKCNDQRYAKKWGGPAWEETFKKPYNREPK